MRRSKNLLLLLLLPFLFTVQDYEQIVPDPIPAKSIPDQKGPLKILTWNLHFLPSLNPFDNVPARARAIADAIAEEDPDILVMQEIFTARARRQIRALLRDVMPYVLGPLNNASASLLVNSGVWVLSKMPLDSLGGIEFEDCSVADCMARKGALMAQGTWHGETFQLVTTHLQAERYPEIRQRQMRQIQQALVAPHRVANTPLFYCGDFNTDMKDAGEYHEMLRCLDAADGLPSGEIQYSYQDSTNGKMLLDYVLVQCPRPIPVLRRILHKAYMPEAPTEELSDHLPLVAEIDF